MSQHHMIKPPIFRASAKVLLAGGYGLLEEGNQGLSLALDRHFYSITSLQPATQGLPQHISVSVSSPQINSDWHLSYAPKDNQLRSATELDNVFVENSVKFALQYCMLKGSRNTAGIDIKILFDRGFLSENQEQKARKGKFIDYEEKASKTGLGSSACVVVVIVGGILLAILEECSLQEINCISHLANVAAQNKVGSNFDISTALFGSQLYTNRLPRKCFEVLQKGGLGELLSIDPQIKRLQPNENLLSGVRSWMLDLRKGSNTRTMVGSFSKSLNEQPEATIKAFYQRSKRHVQEIEQAFSSKLPSKELTDSLRSLNQVYRKFIQQYTQLTKVPVEPPELTPLLDDLLEISQVAYSLCPGSGGYDAIFILALPGHPAEGRQIEEQIAKLASKHSLACALEEVGIEWAVSETGPEELREIEGYLKA